MNSSCSFCISIPSSFLYSSLLFIFLLPFSFLPLLFSRTPPPFPYLLLPFFFLCYSQIIVHSFLQLHHPLTTSSSPLFSNSFCCCSSIERRFP
ncbi:MAG: hypothetical protein JOS17DRAFT_759479 [Linnemannia elongata]|nr:MAG: hypothetical protein JOS17DRAFT_759479 [Linnemannia elongata]